MEKQIDLEEKVSTTKVKRLKHPLDHSKKALVFTQIYLAPEPITVKEIAENTGLALNTVYHYIRELSQENIIYSQTENVGNLIQERWVLNLDYNEKRISQIPTTMNKVYMDRFFTDPKDLGRQLMLLNSMAQPYLRVYEKNGNKFVKIQEHSSRPAIIKLWGLNPEEFEYIVKEIEKIRKKLREISKATRDQHNNSSPHKPLKWENNLFFMVALPNIECNEDF